MWRLVLGLERVDEIVGEGWNRGRHAQGRIRDY